MSEIIKMTELHDLLKESNELKHQIFLDKITVHACKSPELTELLHKAATQDESLFDDIKELLKEENN